MKKDWDGEALLAEAIRSDNAGRDYAMRIDKHGEWFYQNSQIRRRALVELFASVLRRAEDGGYWLVTPAEHGVIEVEDVPFVCVEMATRGSGKERSLRFRTNLDDWVEAGATHPISMRNGPAAVGRAPYLLVRDRLEARLLRPVYYELADMAEPGPDSTLGVWSRGMFFPLEFADV